MAEYILGTGADELERLGLQHRIWADVAVAAWRRAGIGPGSKVLDLGCGPGHASLDLAQLITPAGELVCIDESQDFVNHLNHQAGVRGMSQIRAETGDASDLRELTDFDAVYCRWLLCWLPEPATVVSEMHRVLKPRGRVIIHDYFNWESMTLAPRSQAVSQMVDAAIVSFREKRANTDIMADLPRLLRESGFQLEHFDVHQRAARGGGEDSTVAWPLTWWRYYGQKLVGAGHLPGAVFQQAMQDLDALERNPDWFFLCPPVFEVCGRRF